MYIVEMSEMQCRSLFNFLCNCAEDQSFQIVYQDLINVTSTRRIARCLSLCCGVCPSQWCSQNTCHDLEEPKLAPATSAGSQIPMNLSHLVDETSRRMSRLKNIKTALNCHISRLKSNMLSREKTLPSSTPPAHTHTLTQFFSHGLRARRRWRV